MDIDHYLGLVKKVVENSNSGVTDAESFRNDCDALEAYESKYPEVVDAAYQAGVKAEKAHLTI
jgi:hypothetical protein